ncbi:hypothetical protein SAMN05216359_101155 [Roseateles sp. YR242]|uniref:hypothetical protein n=1 Tax=Roseateles sp. YR242 TaxID=1855305 RepID=UPI0008B39116|nr:hypothetical protein [Roseateles sp. YR242]SEK24464.1 hypothetical protein SAMN05216359_101155 [Roseateles sp. YR242]
MRSDTPRLPARVPGAAAPAAAPEEARAAANGGDAGPRRRDEAGGRRGVSAQRLMGAVVRRLFDDADEDPLIGEAPLSGGSAAQTAGVAVGRENRDGVEARGPAGPGRHKRGGAQAEARGVRRAGPQGNRRPATAEESVWDTHTPVDAAGANLPVVAPESRIQASRHVASAETPRTAAPERVGRSSGLRMASWGALLAAVAALVVLVLIGGFEAPASSSTSGPEAGTNGRPGSDGSADGGG